MRAIRPTKVKVEVSELSCIMIDYCVAMIQGHKFTTDGISWLIELNNPNKTLVFLHWKHGFSPTQKWDQAGAIIEHEKISLSAPKASIYRWTAQSSCSQIKQCGDTPLIAAMRAFIESKLGETVEVPDCLVGE